MVKVSGLLNVGDTLGAASAPASGTGVAVTTTSTGLPSTMTVTMTFSGSGAGAGWQALKSMLAIISIETNRNNLERILLLLFVDLNMDLMGSVFDQFI
jgi:hypothetical protein